MFVAVRGVDAFVGRFIGAAALGFYQMASRIPQLVTEEVALVVSAVTFPAYARLQLSPLALKKVFFQILMAIVSFCLPLGLGMAILAPDIVQLLLGTSWMPAVTALRLLALAGLIVAVLESGGALFVGAGYPNIGFWVHTTRLLATAATIYPLTVSYGVTGAALAALLGTVGALPVWWRGITAVVGTPDTQSVHDLLVSFAAAGIMSLGVAYVRFLVPHGGVTAVALAVSIGALLYVGVQLLAWAKWRCGVWRLVKDVRAAMLAKGGA
jgi:O-antigen/teichoic acid export membrane protein